MPHRKDRQQFHTSDNQQENNLIQTTSHKRNSSKSYKRNPPSLAPSIPLPDVPEPIQSHLNQPVHSNKTSSALSGIVSNISQIKSQNDLIFSNQNSKQFSDYRIHSNFRDSPTDPTNLTPLKISSINSNIIDDFTHISKFGDISKPISPNSTFSRSVSTSSQPISISSRSVSTSSRSVSTSSHPVSASSRSVSTSSHHISTSSRSVSTSSRHGFLGSPKDPFKPGSLPPSPSSPFLPDINSFTPYKPRPSFPPSHFSLATDSYKGSVDSTGSSSLISLAWSSALKEAEFDVAKTIIIDTNHSTQQSSSKPISFLPKEKSSFLKSSSHQESCSIEIPDAKSTSLQEVFNIVVQNPKIYEGNEELEPNTVPEEIKDINAILELLDSQKTVSIPKLQISPPSVSGREDAITRFKSLLFKSSSSTKSKLPSKGSNPSQGTSNLDIGWVSRQKVGESGPQRRPFRTRGYDKSQNQPWNNNPFLMSENILHPPPLSPPILSTTQNNSNSRSLSFLFFLGFAFPPLWLLGSFFRIRSNSIPQQGEEHEPVGIALTTDDVIERRPSPASWLFSWATEPTRTIDSGNSEKQSLDTNTKKWILLNRIAFILFILTIIIVIIVVLLHKFLPTKNSIKPIPTDTVQTSHTIITIPSLVTVNPLPTSF